MDSRHAGGVKARLERMRAQLTAPKYWLMRERPQRAAGLVPAKFVWDRAGAGIFFSNFDDSEHLIYWLPVGI